MRASIRKVGFHSALVLAGGLGLLSTGCTLDKVEDPAVIGPSETGVSVQLTALPDTLNADGVSTSVIQLVLRDERGEALSGRAVFFEHDGDGDLQPSPSSTYVGPVQTGFVMATDGNGVANVIYTAGTGAGRTVTVAVRPYGIDTVRSFFRSVEITQR